MHTQFQHLFLKKKDRTGRKGRRVKGKKKSDNNAEK